MEITLSGLRVTEGELTVFFEAMALAPLSGFEQTDGIPRLISVRADGLPKYTDQRGRRDFYNDFMGYMGTSGYAPVSAYFRRAGQGRGTIDLTLTFEQQGACKLRGLTAHNAPMAIAREFEKGVVLVNPAEEPIVFNLRQTLPRMRASGLWRLRANPASYDNSADTKAMLAYNDGRRENPLQIEVPPLNALFLTKDPPQQ
jgi:hypothetical protein